MPVPTSWHFSLLQSCVWKLSPLPCILRPELCEDCKFLGALSHVKGLVETESRSQHLWLLTDGPIYIKGSYYA